MGIRNCAELGENMIKIVKHLLANKNLVKYLYYTDKDPLNHADLTQQQLNTEVFEKLIKIVPRVGPKEAASTVIVIRMINGSRFGNNREFKNVEFAIEVFTPLTQWIMKGEQLRPFAVLGEIQKSLCGKEVNGLGKIDGGDWELNFLSDEISCYQMFFRFTSYE